MAVVGGGLSVLWLGSLFRFVGLVGLVGLGL